MTVRNPNRIYPICNKVAEIWSTVPDLRFGQLMIDFIRDFEARGLNPFYVEDEQWVELLDQYIKNITNT